MNFGTVHLSGGNTYQFMESLRERKVKELLVKHLANAGLIVGVSAGAIVLTAHIGTSSMCGDVLPVSVFFRIWEATTRKRPKTTQCSRGGRQTSA